MVLQNTKRLLGGNRIGAKTFSDAPKGVFQTARGWIMSAATRNMPRKAIINYEERGGLRS